MDGNDAVLQCSFSGSDFVQIHLIAIKHNNQNLKFSYLNVMLEHIFSIFSINEYRLIVYIFFYYRIILNVIETA